MRREEEFTHTTHHGKPWPTTVSVLWVFLSFAGLQTQAAADDVTPKPRVPGVTLPWAQTDYVECDQACLYNKANENISLQSRYVTEKLKGLISHPEQQEAVLKNYCTPNEAASDCVDRYLAYEIPRLRSMERALVQNAASNEGLKSDIEHVVDARMNGNGASVVEGAAPAFAVYEDASRPPKKAQVTYVPTWQDLKDEYQILRATTQGDSFQNWVASIKPSPPDLSDFLRYKYGPKGDLIAIMGPDGLPAKNMAAFSIAQAQYLVKKDKFEKELSDWRNELIKHPKAIWPGAALQKADPVSYEDGRVSDVEQQAYFAARRALVTAANRSMANLGMVSQRAPSAVAKPKLTYAQHVRLEKTLAAKGELTGNDEADQELTPAQTTANERQEVSVYTSPEDIEDQIKSVMTAAYPSQ